MKNANLSMALITSVAVVASVLVTLFGTVANWQFAFSSRSVWNSSFVMPISTLYASPEKSSRDLFCAFQPNRAIVPSLPLLFAMPVMVRRDRRIGDLLDEARAERGGGNPENHVVVRELSRKIRLRERADIRARPAG